MSRVLVAVDAGTTDVAGAEHLVARLDAVLPADHPSYVASTHVVPGGRTAVAASWTADEPLDRDWVEAVTRVLPGAEVHVEVDGAAAPAPATAAGAAAQQHRDRTAGRLARFAGREDVETRLTVAEVLGRGVVDEVRELGVGSLPGPTVVDLSEWARPTWQEGRVVVLVQRASDGLVPFETRAQIPCCADH